MNGTIYAADLYCGAGGASAGLVSAARDLGARVDLVAVNHWPVAIETHSANFPGSVHLLNDVEKVMPRDAVPGGRLTLLLAGPSCVHFSQARGGKPVSDQQRSSAWEIVRWARDLHIENLLVENVPEFRTWGPVTAEGKPCKERKGMYFRQWKRMLQDLGYTVEDRVLNAAHFGDATTRKRLFVQCRKSGGIVWPKPSHLPPAELAAFPGTLPWVPARQIIDWSIPGTSIFGRKRPLADNTIKRIMAGLEKFCGIPFTIGQQSCASPRSADEPIATVAAAGAISLVQPFLVVLRGTADDQIGGSAKSLDDPAPTICGRDGHLALCEPFLMNVAHSTEGHARRCYNVDSPVPTVTGSNSFAVAQPFLVGVGGPRGRQEAAGVDDPLPTILGQNHTGVVQPFLVRFNGPNGEDRSESIDAPLSTIDGSNRLGLCQPFLVNFYGNGKALSVGDPLDTVTARDRFGLVTPETLMLDKGDRLALLDIHFRMLQPHELAAAHSFPADYKFAGGREDRVKQVGNSWPVRLAAALCKAILTAEEAR